MKLNLLGICTVFIIIVFLFCGCSSLRFKSGWTEEKSPETFKVSFDIQVTRRLSPQAENRIFRLLRRHFFDHILFYRVIPDFVAQFGSIDTTITNQ